MCDTGRTGEASSARATRGGASMRLHVGFMMDPAPARGPDRVPPRSGCRICRGSPAAAPPAGKFPMRPKRVRRACRSMGSGAGEGDRRSDGRQGKRMRPPGCDRPRLWVLMRMRGTRHARYLQTLPQIYSYAAYLTQLYSYAEYATADILRKYSLRKHIVYTHITHPPSLPPTFLTSHPQSRSHLSSFP